MAPLLHAVWIYLLICVPAAIAFLCRGIEPALRVAGALGFSIVLFQLGVLTMVMTAQYRFEYVTVVAGSVLALVLAARLASRYAPLLAARVGVLEDSRPATDREPPT
jgi:hypothetical protein